MNAEFSLAENTILTGERDYEAALAFVVSQAQRSLMMFDPDLSRGSYKSVQLFELLRQFLAASPQNRLQIIMHNSHYLYEHGVRLLAMLNTYGHQMQMLVTDERAQSAQDAFVVADEMHYLHRFHINQARFKFKLNDAKATRPLVDRFGELLEVSPTVISPTTLGL